MEERNNAPAVGASVELKLRLADYESLSVMGWVSGITADTTPDDLTQLRETLDAVIGHVGSTVFRRARRAQAQATAKEVK